MQAHPAGARLPARPRAVAAQPGQLLPGLAAVGRAEQGGVLDPGVDVSGSVSDGSRCQTRLNSQGCGVPSYHWCVPGTPSYANLLPTGSHVLPPSSERWISCPNQPLDCDAYSRFGSTGEPLRW